MACSCGQKSVPPTGAKAAADAAERAKREAEARAANPAVSRIGPARIASGQSQTFVLNTATGMQTFGSELERDAAAARLR